MQVAGGLLVHRDPVFHVRMRHAAVATRQEVCEALIRTPGILAATEDVALPRTVSDAVDGTGSIVEHEILGMVMMSTGTQYARSILIHDILSIRELMEIGELEQHGNRHAVG